MITLVIDAHEIIWALQTQVEETVKNSGLETTDEIVDGLMAAALDAADTVYQHIESDRALNLLQLDDIDRAARQKEFHDLYRGDFFSLLIELCNEDTETLRHLADFGVEALIELFREFTKVLSTDRAVQSRIATWLGSGTLPTGPSHPAFRTQFNRAPNQNDVLVNLRINPQLAGAT